MYRRADEREPQMSNRLALRIAIFGAVALGLFVVLFVRLWLLQVASGEEHLAEANSNRTREFPVRAPRGEILDRDGEVLVSNRTSLALQLNPAKLPADEAERRRELRRLAALTHTTLPRMQREIREQQKISPGAPVTLRRDVGDYLVYYIEENQERFPGIAVERVFVRRYPQGTLAAHMLGSVGEVSEDELKEARFRGLEPGDQVGKEGVEYSYDRFLRGEPGLTRIQVDALGQPTPGGRLVSKPPVPGNNVKLTIDLDLQAAGEAALSGQGLPGAYVAMNVRSGEILAMGSNPTFDPAVLTRTLSQSQVDELYRDPVLSPLTNRAIAGAYPTGSTFKPITALAALESGELSLNEIINDTGSFPLGDGQVLHNAGDAVNGPIALRQALKVSSDVFFYNLGFRTDVDSGAGGPIQQWARALGLGTPTGLDVGGEGSGRVPTPQERNRAFEENTAPGSACGEQVCIEKGEVTDRPWTVGDNVNLAIGQGDLQADPLQMAVAYAAIANGGDVVRPHVGLRIEDPQGRAIQEIDPAVRDHVEIDPAWRQTILDGLRGAAMEPGGTSYNVFGGYPVEIAGKTGTAETGINIDQSWYIAVAPYDDPKYVVAVTIERGGFGADTAAPAARQILDELLKVNEAKIEDVGSSTGIYE